MGRVSCHAKLMCRAVGPAEGREDKTKTIKHSKKI